MKMNTSGALRVSSIGMQMKVRNGGVYLPMKEEIATETWEDVNSILVRELEYGACAFGRVFLSEMKCLLAI